MCLPWAAKTLLRRDAPRRKHRVSLQLRLPPGLQRQLLAGGQLRGGQATSRSPTRTMALFPRSRWTASRPLPAPSSATRPGSSTCPACATTCSTGRSIRSPLYWGLGSSFSYLSRSEPNFHARNVGRFDFYPHLSLPFGAGGWSVVPEAALRDTFYSISQIPDLTGANSGTPSISHDSLNRTDVEASVDLRPPALERDLFARRAGTASCATSSSLN